MSGSSSRRYPKRRMSFSLLLQEEELANETVIKGNTMKALIDMGSTVSLTRENRYKLLRLRGWLRKLDIEISYTYGKTINIAGILRLPVKIGGTSNVYKLYVTLDLCGEIIWVEDWLHEHKVQTKFNPAVFIVNGVKTPLRSAPDNPLSVVVDTDIKLPPR